MTDTPKRCWQTDDPLFIAYHDEEWGAPIHDDRKLFEFLSLSGTQAGLSWITILRKRENYRAAFANFEIDRVAAYNEDKLAELLQNPGIIRNRQKVRSVINNAQKAQAIRREFGSLDTYLWSFVGGKPIIHQWESMAQIPATTEEAQIMSKDLKKRGFTFVGPTICYAFMESVGMVNDHLVFCFRYTEINSG